MSDLTTALQAKDELKIKTILTDSINEKKAEILKVKKISTASKIFKQG